VDTDVLLGLFAAFLVFAGAMMMFYRRPGTTREHSRLAEVIVGAGVGSVAGFLGGLLGVGRQHRAACTERSRARDA